MAKTRVNTVNPKTGKLAIAMVISESGNNYTIQFADGTTITVPKNYAKTF